MKTLVLIVMCALYACVDTTEVTSSTTSALCADGDIECVCRQHPSNTGCDSLPNTETPAERTLREARSITTVPLSFGAECHSDAAGTTCNVWWDDWVVACTFSPGEIVCGYNCSGCFPDDE